MATVDVQQIKDLQKQLSNLEAMMRQLVRRVDLLDRERQRLKAEISTIKSK